MRPAHAACRPATWWDMLLPPPSVHHTAAAAGAAGDCRWPADTPFSTALCGFCPAPLVSLRTLKADVIAGVRGLLLLHV